MIVMLVIGAFLLLGLAEFLVQRAEARQRSRRLKIDVARISATRMDMGGGRIRR